jgi:hypothetical protein
MIGVALSSEVEVLTGGTALASIRLPYSITLSQVRLSCSSAPTGSKIIANVKSNGTSIFSTLPAIDIGQTTSVGGSQPGVLSQTNLPDNSTIIFDVNSVGSTFPGTALKVWLIGV